MIRSLRIKFQCPVWTLQVTDSPVTAGKKIINNLRLFSVLLRRRQCSFFGLCCCSQTSKGGKETVTFRKQHLEKSGDELVHAQEVTKQN